MPEDGVGGDRQGGAGVVPSPTDWLQRDERGLWIRLTLTEAEESVAVILLLFCAVSYWMKTIIYGENCEIYESKIVVVAGVSLSP